MFELKLVVSKVCREVTTVLGRVTETNINYRV
jgi:hypothetical protein